MHNTVDAISKTFTIGGIPPKVIGYALGAIVLTALIIAAWNSLPKWVIVGGMIIIALVAGVITVK